MNMSITRGGGKARGWIRNFYVSLGCAVYQLCGPSAGAISLTCQVGLQRPALPAAGFDPEVKIRRWHCPECSVATAPILGSGGLSLGPGPASHQLVHWALILSVPQFPLLSHGAPQSCEVFEKFHINGSA